jgi:two-component system cell cycle response regulator DivK
VGQKILVVEDNELNLKLFCDLLRAHSYAVEPVRDGREALERASVFSPDLIVMDIQMPHISGLELIERLKSDGELRRTPIMAVTAYAAKGDEERIRSAGAEGYVSKPISVMKFVEAVRALLDAPGEENEGEISARRRFEAPAERLFDAWIDPETTGEWLFRTPEGEKVRAEIDPRVGGRYEIVERRGGEEVLHAGVYEAMERPERLVFTLRVPKYSDHEDRVSISIRPADEGCDLTLTQTRDPEAPASRDQIEAGWRTLLGALAERVEEREADEPPGLT